MYSISFNVCVCMLCIIFKSEQVEVLSLESSNDEAQCSEPMTELCAFMAGTPSPGVCALIHAVTYVKALLRGSDQCHRYGLVTLGFILL